MEIEYRRTIKQSFMVITSERVSSGYEMEIITRNRIDGLLETETAVADGKLQFWYDITGMQELEEYLKTHSLGKQLLEKLIISLYHLSGRFETYLLEENHIILDMHTIYIGNANQEIYFCYLPEEERQLADSFHFLIEYLLTRVEHSDKQAVSMAYDTYQMTIQSGYSVEEICQMIQCRFESDDRECEKDREKENEKPVLQVRKPDNSCYEEQLFNRVKVQIKNLAAGIEENGFPWIIRKNRAERVQMVFEPEEVRQESESTIFLGELQAQRECIGVLEYQGMEHRDNMRIDRTPYHIGSSKDADGVIANKSVSRLHARIIREEEKYFIEDLNSRNGTWIDGELLNYRERVHLVPGACIIFAREKYCFIEK